MGGAPRSLGTGGHPNQENVYFLDFKLFFNTMLLCPNRVHNCTLALSHCNILHTHYGMQINEYEKFYQLSTH